MDTALPQKFPFILDRNLANANCTENRVCTSCDIVVLAMIHSHKKKTYYIYTYIHGVILPGTSELVFILLAFVNWRDSQINLSESEFKKRI